MDTPLALRSASPADLRAGVRVSALSAVWTILSSAAAIGFGAADGSLVLIVFGLTGLLDAAGSLTLVLHFRHALRHEAISERRERVALHVVSWGLIAIGVSTVIESVRRLLTGVSGHDSPIGTVIAGAAVIALGVLTVGKRRVARRLASEALRADSWLSAAGAGLAVVTVASTILAAGSSLAWIDPAAALIVAAAAAGVGIAALRREESALFRRSRRGR